jgi:hypothetical protein
MYMYEGSFFGTWAKGHFGNNGKSWKNKEK